MAFLTLLEQPRDEMVKPESWNDEELKALSVRVFRAAPNAGPSCEMRAEVLSGYGDAWEVGFRSAAELTEAAAHFDRAAAHFDGPETKAQLVHRADWCRSQAEGM